MINQSLRYLFFGFFLVLCRSLFSQNYKKCTLFHNHHGRQIGSLFEQKVPLHSERYYIQPLFQTRKKIEYKKMDYIYHQYVGSGGSGEVYLVEDLKTKEPKIFKRFFKEKNLQFQQQNFIMTKLGYKVQWMKDLQNGIPKKSNYSKDNHLHKQIPTIAIYPSKQSISLRDIEFYNQQGPIIFYKILIQIDKTHRNSIIHNDLKMGNFLINQNGRNFKIFDTQLIDWNLASFYYLGTQSTAKKGTLCYYSPQQIMKAIHITPAIDVWALGIVMFSFFTQHKPFFNDCKQNNLKAIVSLVGIDKIIQMQRKYHYPIQNQYYDLLEQLIENKKIFQPKNIRNRIPEQKLQLFTNDLIDIFEKMLTVDPEERITISELLDHPYFQKIKRIPPMFQQKIKSENKQNKQKTKKQDNKQINVQKI